MGDSTTRKHVTLVVSHKIAAIRSAPNDIIDLNGDSVANNTLYNAC